MGRFLQPDPRVGSLADPQSLNRFAYVRNNPLGLVDPSGLDAEAPSSTSGVGFGVVFDFGAILRGLGWGRPAEVGPAPAPAAPAPPPPPQVPSVAGSVPSGAGETGARGQAAPVDDVRRSSRIVFDRLEHQITVFDQRGREMLSGAASNNVGRGKQPWPAGLYLYRRYNRHPESGPNGGFGSHGIFIFDVPGRTGMGIHSGRADRGGAIHPTEGCIRCSDDSMSSLYDIHVGYEDLESSEFVGPAGQAARS
jgi:hypothetical protein